MRCKGNGGVQKTNNAKVLFTRLCSKQRKKWGKDQHCSTKATLRPPHLNSQKTILQNLAVINMPLYETLERDL